VSEIRNVPVRPQKRIAAVVAVILAIILAAPTFAPHDPLDTHPQQQLQPPSWENLLGTDELGRDVFSRFLYGGQRTLLMASGAAVLALSIGIVVGVAASIEKQGINAVFSTFMNALLAIPLLILALALITVSGAGELQVIIATGFALIAPMAIFTRAAFKEIRHQPYITAAISLGSTDGWLWMHYFLPNVRPLLSAYGVVIFLYCLLNNAALSFLGLGGEPSAPEWGRMLADGRYVLRSAPWVALAAAMGIVMLALLLNLLARRLSR